MRDRGYDEKLSVGLILGGAGLAPIIPPSLMVIIMGSLVDVSIAKLLIAGIVPGLILAGIFLGYMMVRVAMDPSTVPPPASEGERSRTGCERLAAFGRMLPFSIIIFAVLGLIMLGIATPSESAATGVAGAVLVAIFYRRFSLKMAWESVMSSLGIAAMIIAILACSKFFSQLLSFTGATAGLVQTATELNAGPILMLIVLMLIPLIACMFIDQIAFMMVVVPIYAPIVKLYGFDPVWFWTLFLINLAVGSLTPPFGYNLFAAKGSAPWLKMPTIFAAAVPIVICYLIGLILFALFPPLINWLPSLI